MSYCTRPPPKVQEALGKVEGRVYTLDAIEAKGNGDLIADTCYLHNQSLCIMFDYGASHSFIMAKCVHRIRLEAIPLLSPMVVTTITKSNVETQ